jgi:hypothetical protein
MEQSYHIYNYHNLFVVQNHLLFVFLTKSSSDYAHALLTLEFDSVLMLDKISLIDI